MDSTDLLCTCSTQGNSHILLYKRLDSAWFSAINGDGTTNNTLQARSDALSDWVHGYFALQNGLELRSPEPNQQGQFDLRTPWIQWSCVHGSITAVQTDTLLAIRWIPDSAAYAPETLYKEMLNE